VPLNCRGKPQATRSPSCRGGWSGSSSSSMTVFSRISRRG
jgi:hypothetical protein